MRGAQIVLSSMARSPTKTRATNARAKTSKGRPGRNPRAALKCASPRSAVKSSFAPDQCIGAPRPGPGEGEIEENEAVERGKFAAVQQRIESLAGMRHEIGGRGESRENEGDRSREQADREQQAADQLDQPADPRQRIDLDVCEHRGHRKAENLACAVLKQSQPGEDAEDAEHAKGARRPDLGKSVRIHRVSSIGRLVIEYNYLAS